MTEQVERSRWRLIVFFVTLGLLLIFFIWSALNVSGFCVAERRYLTESEQMNAAIDNVYQSHLAHYKNKSGLGISGPLVRYAGLDEFKSVNPNCCSLSGTAQEGYRVSWTRQLIGNFRTFVRVNYAEEAGSGDQSTPIMREVFVAVTNCGRTGDGIE